MNGNMCRACGRDHPSMAAALACSAHTAVRHPSNCRCVDCRMVPTRPDGRGCGAPMGLSENLPCFCGMVGVPLCRRCEKEPLGSRPGVRTGPASEGYESERP